MFLSPFSFWYCSLVSSLFVFFVVRFFDRSSVRLRPFHLIKGERIAADLLMLLFLLTKQKYDSN